jgi:hypothetical protein
MVVSMLLVSAMLATAQIEVTAETMGKGKVAAFVSTNAIVAKDFTTLSFSTAQVWYGLNNRLDVFAGASETIALGQKQTAVQVGGNLTLLKGKGWALSTFHVLNTPLNRRSDSSDVLWLAAAVVSKNLTIHGFAFTPYSGYAVTVPLGNVDDKLFTPAEPMHNVPLGVMVPKGKFAFFAEFNFGRRQQIGGGGLAYTF